MGLHRRSSVLDVQSGGVHNPISVYDDAYISHRARLILYAIDARRQRWPDETPYRYAPLSDQANRFRWMTPAMEDIRDNTEDQKGAVEIVSDSEVNFKGSLEGDNGLKFCVKNELEGNVGDASVASISGEFGTVHIGADTYRARLKPREP